MDEDLIDNIRARALQCRRLAALIGNDEVRETLLGMAEEAEADVRRLQERYRHAAAKEEKEIPGNVSRKRKE